MWLKSLQQHFNKKRTQQEAASSSLTDEHDTGELVISIAGEDEEYSSRPKRRSVSIEVGAALRPEMRPSMESSRRTSLEQWHEARRARNSMEGLGTTTTDKLVVAKAGTTAVVNKTYITIKHLGSGTFGRVMLCFNVIDQRLYAMKVCRKSQFVQTMSRYNSGRLRRSNQSPNSSVCFTNRSSGFGANSFSAAPLPNSSSCAVSCQTRVTNISATSAATDVNLAAAAAAAAAAATLLNGNGAATPASSGLPPLAGHGWPNALQQQQQQQQQYPNQQRPQLGQYQQQLQQQLPAKASSFRQPSAFAMDQPPRPGRSSHSCGGAGGQLNSSGSLGWGMTNTHGSTGSASSAYQEAMMRFQTDEVVKEIAILKKLSHPNIVNLVEVIDDPTTDSLLLIMEYVEGGTLESRQIDSSTWEPLPEKDVWRYVREVLQGLDYLHNHKVVHGDLKPANLLLDSNSRKVKIADFGSSSIMTGSEKVLSMRNCPGFSTPAFRSPESLTSGYQPSFEMDMWALGVCIYMWVYGRLPFTGAAPFIIYEKIRAQDVGQPTTPEVSPELRELISQLLDKDVLRRLDVAGAMQHPWVTLGGSAPLASIRQQEMSGKSCVSFDGIAVSQGDIDAAIRQIGSNMLELMDVVFEEVHLQPGQELIAAGEAADRIYLIASGGVEMLQPAGAGPGSGAEPLISGLEVEVGDPQDSDMWDDNSISELSSSPGLGTMLPLNEPLQPWDTSVSSPTAALRVVAVKGPGDSLGVPLVPGSAGSSSSSHVRDRRWRVSVCACSSTTVFCAKLEDLSKLAEVHPEMETAVKQIVVQQETDMMVAEAMRQLRLYSDCQTTRLPKMVAASS